MKHCSVLYFLGVVLLGACGASNSNSGTGFATTWQNDNGQSIAAVERKLRPLPLVPNARLAVGVTDTGLVATTLDGKSHWTHGTKSASLPIIAGNLVIVSEGDQIVALDAASGNKVWSVGNRGLGLRGAGNDGTSTALILANPQKSLFLAVSASGAALGSVETRTPLGAPAARGGIAFVPWSNQYVSALDMRNGDELGRLLMREQVSRALDVGGVLYFGERGLTRFDEKACYGATNQTNHIALPKLDLPGKPSWIDSGMQNTSSDADARTKIRIYAAPAQTPNENLTLGAGTFAATYFHVLFGLDAKTGALAWVRALPADVVGGAAASSGFVVCDSAGQVRLLDSAGDDANTLDLGSKLRVCVVDAGAEPIPPAAGRGSIATQISAALDQLEPDMAEAERYLVGELGKQTEPLVTKTLIDLSSSPRISPELRSETRRLLALRTNGTEYMLAALERHYDFVSGVLLPPPVGPLADALAASNETRAAPLLAKHLNDPANSADDVAHAARALVKLATKAEFEDLRTFFALYRATADEDALVAAVVASADALIRVGGDAGREIVDRAAHDPLTQADVRRALPDILLAKAQSAAAVPTAVPTGPKAPAENGSKKVAR
ncbi:MAG TPA: PQQ-binding-like beta-propeller repeat protein [Polyangiaceae bacterium]|nr:PQQ-binding-like beta-propeller repeat protein [Polyangiaceae bacterium]